MSKPNPHTKINTPSIAVTITETIQETPSVKTFRFDRKFPSEAGQFVMVWVPRVDEVPMALSSNDSITVQKVGDATEALFALSQGEQIGIRGPYGNGFPTTGRTLAVAGGIGAAPLFPMAMAGRVTTFLLGARTAEELPFRTALQRCTNLQIATDDGSAGYHGFVPALFDGLDLDVYDQICVCGPELMMKVVLDRLTAKQVLDRTYFSLHRYMKCGVGVCGSCCIDPEGVCVCREGPVFSGERLIQSEFGNYSRNASGQRVHLGRR
jgi:dihydroorotate dehydrogenase electron transfer subunit